jgi:hypothetical protein
MRAPFDRISSIAAAPLLTRGSGASDPVIGRSGFLKINIFPAE